MPITLDATLPAASVSAEAYALVTTSHDLIEEVMSAVQDASYTEGAILELFNECLLELAGEFLLPDLEAWADVATTANINQTRLPADYMRELRYAHSLTHNRPIRVYGSAAQIVRWFAVQDQAGRVIAVAPKGRNLFYQRVPGSAESIRINYYRFPTRLQVRADKPLEIPWHLAKPLLKHYALRELFSLIEDGMEGAKVNTAYHDKRFTAAKEALELFIGPEERLPVEYEDEIKWEEYL
jgi:hypothetical protein